MAVFILYTGIRWRPHKGLDILDILGYSLISMDLLKTQVQAQSQIFDHVSTLDGTARP